MTTPRLKSYLNGHALHAVGRGSVKHLRPKTSRVGLFSMSPATAISSAQRPWCKLHGRSRVPKPKRRGGCRQ
jgi:hypothetical protein